MFLLGFLLFFSLFASDGPEDISIKKAIKFGLPVFHRKTAEVLRKSGYKSDPTDLKIAEAKYSLDEAYDDFVRGDKSLRSFFDNLNAVDDEIKDEVLRGFTGFFSVKRIIKPLVERDVEKLNENLNVLKELAQQEEFKILFGKEVSYHEYESYITMLQYTNTVQIRRRLY